MLMNDRHPQKNNLGTSPWSRLHRRFDDLGAQARLPPLEQARGIIRRTGILSVAVFDDHHLSLT